MMELTFACAGAEPDRFAATPTITLRLQIGETSGIRLQALAIRTQVRIDPTRRRYGDDEAEALRDLFGDRARWGSTLKPLQLAFVNLMVPAFSGETAVPLALPCSYDFEVAAHKYLYALTDGEIPLLLLFSGTAFTEGPHGLNIAPVPWSCEARYRLPVAVWRQTMELHFPGTAWLRLGKGSFDALYQYRQRNQLLSWDDAVQRLLKEADQ